MWGLCLQLCLEAVLWPPFTQTPGLGPGQQGGWAPPLPGLSASRQAHSGFASPCSSPKRSAPPAAPLVPTAPEPFRVVLAQDGSRGQSWGSSWASTGWLGSRGASGKKLHPWDLSR